MVVTSMFLIDSEMCERTAGTDTAGPVPTSRVITTRTSPEWLGFGLLQPRTVCMEHWHCSRYGACKVACR